MKNDDSIEMDLALVRSFVVSRAWGMRTKDDGVVTQAADGHYISEIAKYFKVTSVAMVLEKPEAFTFVGSYGYRLESASPLIVKGLHQNIIGSTTTRLKAWLSNIFVVIGEIPGVDTVFVFMSSGLAVIAAVFGRLFRKKVIVYSGNDWAHDIALAATRENRFVVSLKSKLAERLESLAMRAAHVRIVNSPKLFRSYRYFPGITEQVRPVTMFTASDAFETRDLQPANGIRLCSVGAIIPRKNHEVLFKSFTRVRTSFPGARLLLVGAKGDPEHVKFMERLENQLGISEAVSYLGYIVSKDELKHVLRSSDIFVLPSLNEGFPRVVWEAMLQGLPCVVSDIPNIRAELDGRDACLYCNPKDPESIANAIRTLINDEHLRKRVADNGLHYAKGVFSETWQEQLRRVLCCFLK